MSLQRLRLTLLLGLAVLAAWVPAQVYVRAGQWHVIVVNAPDAVGHLGAELATPLGSADLYLRRGAAPTLSAYDVRVTSSPITGRRSLTWTLNNRTQPPLTSDPWFIAAYAKKDSYVFLTAKTRAIPSQFAGKGAVPFGGGTSFRVWAPFASSVAVAGDFNGWSSTAAPLQSESNGWWSVDVRRARAGQQYKFVIRNGSNTLWRNDPYARQVTSSVGNSVIYDHRAYVRRTTDFTTPWWNQAVLMQMHIGTYNDVPGGLPGNFNSAIARLDHLRDLGVNAIQLLPVQEFAGDYSWGYNPAHLFAVESVYGGPDGLKRFVDEANARGIAVLTDLVHNHYGPSDLGIWQFDGWSQNGLGGIYFYNDGRAHTAWGSTRPDFGRPEVRQFIVDNQNEFLNEYQLSGIRWDSTLNIRRSDWGDNPEGWGLLQWLNDDVDRLQPWKINIAEDLQNNDWITRPTSQGGAGFDAQWSNYVHTVRNAIIGSNDNDRDLWAVRGAITEAFNGNPFSRVIYTESHDENANGKQRVTSSIDPGNPFSYWSQKRSTLGAALTLTTPGIPMLFQGQEFLEDGYFQDTDPVDWSKNTTFGGIRNLYRDLIRMRRNLNGQTAGLTGAHINVFHTNNNNKVMAYHRWLNGGSNDDVVVVANFRNQTWWDYRIGFPHGGGWRVVFNSDWNGYSPLFGNVFSPDITANGGPYDGLGFSGTVNLAPYSVVVFARM